MVPTPQRSQQRPLLRSLGARPWRSLARSLWPRPRVRRPVDGARLVLSAVVLVLLVLLAVLDGDLVRSTGQLVQQVSGGLPRTALSVVNVVASVAVLGVLLGIAVDALRWRPFTLVSGAIACALGPLAGLALAELVRLGGSDAAATALIGPPHDSAGLSVTAAVAAVVGADLQRRRWVGPARATLLVAVACALALGSLTVPGAAWAVVVGTTAGLAVRFAAGVVPARPGDDLLRAVVARAGWEPAGLHAVEEVAGRARYAAVGPDGGELRITVVDPDRRGVTVARRLWRLIRLRTDAVGRPALTLRGQLERQVLTAALAETAGVVAPRALALLHAGPALVLVERPAPGTPLSTAGEPAVAQALPDVWEALRRLHDAGLAHGALRPEAVVLLPAGGAGFAELAAAQPAASDLQRELDVVALLVVTATRVGAGPAVDVLRRAALVERTAPSRLAALLHPPALPPALRRAVRGSPLLGELREAVAGTGAPGGSSAAPRLERLRPRTVVAVAAATLAAHILATQLSKVGIADALRQARPGWLGIALLGSVLTYLGAAVALQAFVPAALRLGRTTLVQLASSWLTLVTPPAVGHIGLNIRYLQRAGVATAVATASVAVKETVTVAVTVPVLLLCGWLSGVSASRLALLPQGNVLAVLLVATGALALVAVLPPTRRLLRRRLQPLVRRTLPQLLAAAGNPRRLGTGVAGVLLLNAGYVLALDAALRAFAVAPPLPVLVVVYLAGSTLGSVAPTPGGLGAVEAALVGGLTTTGVPVATALAGVLVFRTATFWLPAPVGWVAFVAAQRRGWV